MAHRSDDEHRVQPIERFPARPRKDGRFQKRIRGTLYYFGRDGDREKALAEYDLVKRDLYAGRVPRVGGADESELTIAVLANKFLDEKKAEADEGSLEPGTYRQHRRALRRFVKFFGKGRVWTDLVPDDFAAYRRHLRVAKKLGQYAYNRERASVVAMFNHADEQDWIGHVPKLGKGFRRIPKGELREKKVERLFSRDDVNALLGVASPDLYGMILLGLNGGYGAEDCRGLAWHHVDLDKALIKYRRKKTNIPRTTPLWPETVDALRALKRLRPGCEQVFVTRHGNAWSGTGIAHLFADLAEKAKLELPDGVGIYACRHTFATLANEVRDTDARRHLMGRLLPNLDDVYVETLFVERLKSVVNHVRSKLQIAEMIGRHAA